MEDQECVMRVIRLTVTKNTIKLSTNKTLVCHKKEDRYYMTEEDFAKNKRTDDCKRLKDGYIPAFHPINNFNHHSENGFVQRDLIWYKNIEHENCTYQCLKMQLKMLYQINECFKMYLSSLANSDIREYERMNLFKTLMKQYSKVIDYLVEQNKKVSKELSDFENAQ